MKTGFYSRYLFFAGVLAVYFTAMCPGCNRVDAIPEKEADCVRSAKTIQLKKSCFNRTRIFPGSAKALQDVDLGFRVSGPVPVPLEQIVTGTGINWEDPVVHRCSRRRAIAVQCDPRWSDYGQSSETNQA